MKHPMQPVYRDEHGTVRFRANEIVRFLLEFSRRHGVGLNELAAMPFDDDDRAQLAQLIGYSVSGYGDLSYAADVPVADDAAPDPSHGSEPVSDDVKRRDERNARLAAGWGVGATGGPPTSDDPRDRGGLVAALEVEGDRLVVYFGERLSWVAMTREEALLFARALIAKAALMTD